MLKTIRLILKPWLDWRHKRKPHVFRAWRYPSGPSTNLAEIGHSGKLEAKLEHLEESITFEAQRVTNVVAKAEKTQKKVDKIEREIANHDIILKRMAEADNKLERMSRRSNIRIVGLKDLQDHTYSNFNHAVKLTEARQKPVKNQ